MKILLIHYRYYISSGPERYLFNVKNLLEKKGDIVIPFSINYSDNQHSDYNKYFIDPVGSKSQFHFKHDASLGFKDKLTIVKNIFFNKQAYDNLEKLILDEKPDVAYILQYWGKLSVSIFKVLTKYQIPIIHRVSDYNLICPKNILFCKNRICIECKTGYYSSVKNKCIHDKFLPSFFNYLAYKHSNIKPFFDSIHKIVSPSRFTIKIFKEFPQIQEDKLVHIPTFIPEEEINTIDIRNLNVRERYLGNEICFLGRIEYDKGLHILIGAIKLFNERGFFPKVNIIGDYSSKYANNIISYCKNNNVVNIVFHGFLNKHEYKNILMRSKFAVIPSVWYDNMPNSFIESQTFGLPIFASDIGSLTELVVEGYNGFLFKPANSMHLAEKIENSLCLSFDQYFEMVNNSINEIKIKCSEELHYKALYEIFVKLKKND